MTLTREQLRTGGIVVGALAAVAFVLYAVNRRATLAASRPVWTDAGQPPDGVASQVTTLTDDQQWAANRCRPMAAPCRGYTAGTRVRRTYPASVCDDPHDVVQGRVGLGFRLGGC